MKYKIVKKIILAVFGIMLCSNSIFAIKSPSCVGYEMVKEECNEINLYSVNDDGSKEILAKRIITENYEQKDEVGKREFKPLDGQLDIYVKYVSNHYFDLKNMGRKEFNYPYELYKVMEYERQYEIYIKNIDGLIRKFGFSKPTCMCS